MKKIIIAAVLSIALVGAGYVFISSNSKKKETNNSSTPAVTESAKTKGKTACELLTLDDAKSLLGENATKSEGNMGANLATNDSVIVDNCTYSADGATLGDLKQITIQRHFGDNSQVNQAYDNYLKEFPGDTVPDLGDRANYGTNAKQVQVVKGDYWLSVFGGSINAGEAANKELGLKAARLALNKL